MAAEAADCLAKAGRYREAVAAIERSQIPDWHQRAERYLAAFVLQAPRRSKERHARAREVVEEGERLMRAGDCRRALPRFCSVTEAEKALDAFVCLGYDEEALLWFVEVERLDLAERYLQRRSDYAPTPELAARIAAALDALKYRLGEPERRSGDSFGATFFRRAIRAHGVDTVWASVDTWLSGLLALTFADTNLAPGLVDLIFEIPHYNRLAHLLDYWSSMRGGLDTLQAGKNNRNDTKTTQRKSA